jgi:hypothetical protein
VKPALRFLGGPDQGQESQWGRAAPSRAQEQPIRKAPRAEWCGPGWFAGDAGQPAFCRVRGFSPWMPRPVLNMEAMAVSSSWLSAEQTGWPAVRNFRAGKAGLGHVNAQEPRHSAGLVPLEVLFVCILLTLQVAHVQRVVGQRSGGCLHRRCIRCAVFWLRFGCALVAAVRLAASVPWCPDALSRAPGAAGGVGRR